VPGRLLSELKQTKPFATLETEAILNLQKTMDVIGQHIEGLLKPHNISGTQYNVLRILRGAGTDGLKCSEIGERMVTHDPDITRLLDRIEKRGLISRAREEKDRRVVRTRITRAGLELLERMDKPVEEGARRMLGHLGHDRLSQLIELLEAARDFHQETT
jgi:DNA-binding MarR family transcriptional regulator